MVNEANKEVCHILHNEKAMTKAGRDNIIAECSMKDKICSSKQKDEFITKNAEKQNRDEIDEEDSISDSESLACEGPSEDYNYEVRKKCNAVL